MKYLIRKKNIEFQKVFETIPNFAIEEVNEKQWKLLSRTGLTWKNGEKFGYIHEGKESLRIDIDFPVNSFTKEELIAYTGLPLKKDISKKTGISHINPRLDEDKHDVIRIILYEDQLETYQFDTETFTSLFREIYKVNIP